MTECRCTHENSSRCPRPDHNALLLVVACDSCGKKNPGREFGRRGRCRCGSLYGTFSRVDNGRQKALIAA